MTAFIIDDEPLARSHLGHMLREDGVEVLGEAGDVEEAMPMVEELVPDVVFMDVRMPGLSGIEATTVFSQLEPAPLIVLVTGYSEYAAEAFTRSALDYIVKPVSRERLAVALAKVRKQLALHRKAMRTESVRRTVRHPSLQRLPIRVRGAIRLVPVERIVYARAGDKTVLVKTKEAVFRTGYTLKELEEILPPTFMRIHSSCIVNLVAIDEIQLLGNHTYSVQVVTGEELPVGRLQYPKLQERLGFPPEA